MSIKEEENIYAAKTQNTRFFKVKAVVQSNSDLKTNIFLIKKNMSIDNSLQLYWAVPQLLRVESEDVLKIFFLQKMT